MTTINSFLVEKWRRLRKGISDGGLEYLVCSFASRFPEWLFRYYHTVLIRGDQIKLIVRRRQDYKIRLANADDAGDLEEVGIARRKALYRLDRGDTCAIVSKDKRVATISWAATGRLYNRYAGSIIDTGEDGLYLFGVYSVPDERMKGHLHSCYQLQFEHHAKQGRTLKYGVIDILNKGSLKAHRRMGFQIAGETYCVTLFGMSICYYKTWPHKTPKLHLFFRRPPQNLQWV